MFAQDFQEIQHRRIQNPASQRFSQLNDETYPVEKHIFALFGAFPHIFSHFIQSFSELFLQDFFLELRGFTTVLVQRDEKRIKDNKKKTKPSCTLVVARLSSSEYWPLRVCSRSRCLWIFPDAHDAHITSHLWHLDGESLRVQL